MPRKFHVILSAPERAALQRLVKSGTAPARRMMHAQILLKADEGPEGSGWSNAAITEAFGTAPSTIGRVRGRFVREGLEAALHPRGPTGHPPPKLDGSQEAHLIALACSETPEGQDRWSLRLLAAKFVELGHVDYISHETVRQVLKRGRSSPGAKSGGVSPRKRTASS
jgi:transposase